MNTGVKTQTVFGALDAFMPAMLVLGDDLATAEKTVSYTHLTLPTSDLV